MPNMRGRRRLYEPAAVWRFFDVAAFSFFRGARDVCCFVFFFISSRLLGNTKSKIKVQPSVQPAEPTLQNKRIYIFGRQNVRRRIIFLLRSKLVASRLFFDGKLELRKSFLLTCQV